VDEFPVVTHYDTVADRVRARLQSAAGLVVVLDSGGLFCPCLIGGCGSSPAAADELSRIERLGMVVTVVSAESRTAIEAYLDGQGVDHSAVDLSSLDCYFGSAGHAFVCGWVARRDQPATANGLKVTFPSPTIWFPLRPTRIYTDPVETVVYVRSFVKPTAECILPGLTGQPIFGHVEAKGVAQSFRKDRSEDADNLRRYGSLSHFEPMTRVSLTTDPRQWDRDLDLEPGTDQKTAVALAVLGWVGYLGPLWSAVLGGILGLTLPLFVIARDDRRKLDLLFGAIAGAAIALSLWVTVLVFLAWRSYRPQTRPYPPGAAMTLFVFAVVHAIIAAMVCLKLGVWLSAEV
jgi:hypothetical protein